MVKLTQNAIIVIVLIVGFFALSEGGLLGITALQEGAYLPTFAQASCALGQTTFPAPAELDVDSPSTEDFECTYQECRITKICTLEAGKYTIDGIEYQFDSIFNQNVFSEAGGFECLNIDTIPSFPYKDKVVFENNRQGLFGPIDTIFKISYEGTRANLQVTSSDDTFAAYNVGANACDFGLIEPSEAAGALGSGEIAPETLPDTPEWQIGDIRSFTKSYRFISPGELLLFQNSVGEICYNREIHEIQTIDNLPVLVGTGDINPQACSAQECKVRFGDNYFITEDWQCTLNQENAQTCFSDEDAGGIRCEDGTVVRYTCVNGEINRQNTGTQCCAVASDCPTDKPICDGGTCRAEGTTYETCGINECCIGFEDLGYDPSLGSIYERGKDCPTGTFCNIPSGDFKGSCSLLPPPKPKNTICTISGEIDACSVDSKPGIRVCQEDNTWGSCKTTKGGGISTILLVVGGIIILGVILFLGTGKSKRGRKKR